MNKGIGIRAKTFIYFSLLFAAVLSLVIITSLFGLPFTSYSGRYGEVRAMAFRHLSESADLKKERLLRWLGGQRRGSRVLAENALLREGSSGLLAIARGQSVESNADVRSELKKDRGYRQTADYLLHIKKTYGFYETVRLIEEKSGTVVASTEEAEVGVAAVRHLLPSEEKSSDKPHFAGALLSGDTFIEAAGLSRAGLPLLTISHAVRGGGGSTEGVLVMTVDAGDIIKTVTRDDEDGSETILVDEELSIQAPLRHALPGGVPARPMSYRLKDVAALLAAGGDEGTIETADYRGKPVFAAYRHIHVGPEFSWGLIVTREKGKLLAPIRREIWYMLLAALTGLVAAMGLTAFIARKLASPVEHLGLAAAKVASGDMSARVEVKTSDEVGQLASAFNDMVGNVQERQKELTEANEKLIEEIAERKQAQEIATELLRELETIFGNIPVGIFYLDSNFRVLTANRHAFGITGLTEDGLLGKPCYETIGEYAIDPTRRGTEKICSFCKKAECIKSKAPVVIERPYRDKTLRVTTVPEIDEKGEIARFVELMEDITDRKRAEEERCRLEEQLRQSQKMEAVGQLAGGIAHDFNNRLAAIIGAVYMLKRRLDDKDPLHSLADQIFASAEKASTLTKSLLAFSRKQLINPAPVSLNGIVRELDDFLRSVIGERIELRVELDPSEPVVKADSGQIEHVIVNLVSNARDAMPEGGVITINTGNTGVIGRRRGDEPPGGYAFVSVADTGTGMDEATKEKIFEPFFTTKGVGKGTGLGLSMVYGTVKQHGGHVEVETAPGKGTAVSVCLPMALSPDDKGKDKGEDKFEGRAGDVKPEGRLRPAGGSETVLIVEDEADIRKSFRIILESFGYKVMDAPDGETAIKKFTESGDGISALILDIVLPGKNGIVVFDEIRKLKPSVKALFMSGYASDIAGGKEPEGEGIRFVQKPVHPDELLSKLRELLNG